jgi:acetyltransferase-like isoleucine patch superfamily enzyme
LGFAARVFDHSVSRERWERVAVKKMISHSISQAIVQLRGIFRSKLMRIRIAYLRGFWGHQLDPTVRISFSAYLDRTNPNGVCIGAYTIVTHGAMILSHDYTRSISAKTQVGRNCLIGVNAIIMPGIAIGDEVVVGAGAVVTRDVPNNSLVLGNPAQVVGHIRTSAYGRIIERF